MSDAAPDLGLGGSYALGTRRVRRVGFGAMQPAGDNVFGPVGFQKS
jgi:pyridoxine 4-dehydrogenase